MDRTAEKYEITGLSPEELEIIRQAVARSPEVEKCILFGSRAKGNYRRGSDVDLVLLGKGVDEKTRFNVSDFLNEETLLPYFFDVLIFDKIENPELIDHINRIGKIVYQRD